MTQENERKRRHLENSTAPPGATDCHFHIFGPTTRYPLAPAATYVPPAASVAGYLQVAERLGIDRVVVVQPSVYGADNRCTLDAVSEFGLSRARGIAVIDDRVTPATLRDMDRRGIRGVRFNCINSSAVSLDKLSAVARMIEPLGWHVQLWCHGYQLPALEPTLLSLPVATVIDHSGSIPTGHGVNHEEFQTLLRLAASGTCWVKLTAYRFSEAGAPYGDTLPFTKALVEAAPQRCVWGTDWPHIYLEGRPLPDTGALLNLLYESVPDEATRRMILTDNPASLYGFA